MSRNAASSPAARPASMSRALASRISSTRSSTAAAIAPRAAFLVAVSSGARSRVARLAARHTSATNCVVMAMGNRLREAAQLSTK